MIKYFKRLSVKRSNRDFTTTCEYYSNEEVSTREHCVFNTTTAGDISVSPDQDAHDTSQIDTNTVCQVSDRYTDFPCKGTDARNEAMANYFKDNEIDESNVNIYKSHVEEDSKNVYCGLNNNLAT